MITLTRLSGSEFVLNSDLIERVEETPDTVVTLVDGKKYVVAETPAEIVRAVREHRGWIIALSTGLPSPDVEPEPTHLAPVSALRFDGQRFDQHREV
ncbi:flagellar FlbD family protein [Nocardioides daejeonensis]|uniref:flagellar FlbD family protein n=1 Tax=Nocardioides daejeonensis TaxID=1046556 RepID=UPI000D744143|nr:flagellar FlbD family protein [Nocardioides daejeonensis]